MRPEFEQNGLLISEYPPGTSPTKYAFPRRNRLISAWSDKLNDLDAYKEGLRTKSALLDCLWGELYGSINTAEISEGSITPEHAAYLRKKFLSL